MNEIIGRRFGRVVVTARTDQRNRVICKCDCGNESRAWTANLYTGKTKSCGCGSVVKRTHGHSRRSDPTYLSWLSMKSRCKPGYPDPAYVGVTLCPQWEAFEGFLADMGERPKGKTLDRIDSRGNYEPSNCRWATPLEQSRNRPGHNALVTVDGKQVCQSEAAELLGVCRSTIRRWRDRGETHYQTATTL